MVWLDHANGKTYVVNGHHRGDLAKRLGEKSITVKYLDAKDARAKGALIVTVHGAALLRRAA